MTSATSNYALRLSEDTLPGSARQALPPRARVIYARRGDVVVASAGRDVRLAEDTGWHGAGACEVRSASGGATLWRWELIRGAVVDPGGDPTRVVLEHAIDLDPAADYLMRADRVDFAPGGVALPHRHRGGGIRCLVAGTLDVTVGDAPARRITPGGAWFESGREPVLAVASKEDATSFIRVAILPREIRGRTSIMYVNPSDAERGRPRTYTVYVDEPITLD